MMNRTEFLNKAIRFLLFGLLALIAVLTGSRAVTGNDCSACPGKGICRGDTDCTIFLSEKK
jgi:hypothetical protein